MNSSPIVSILFPVFNESPNILILAIESILGQSHQDFELLIIDDSDEERAINIIDDYASSDRRIIVLRSHVRRGLVRSLNHGLSISSGCFIARADSDDIQSESRILKQVSFLKSHNDIDVLGSCANIIDYSGNTIGFARYPEIHENIIKSSCLKNPMAHPTVMFRRRVYERFGGYNQSYCAAEDYELWMRYIKRRVKFHNVAEALVNLRVADLSRRPNSNWIWNLRAKIEHFSFSHFFHRISGLFIVLIFLCLPRLIKAYAYDMYLRCVRRSGSL